MPSEPGRAGKRARFPGGFTLLELLASLSIGAVLAGALAASLRLGVTAHRRAGEEIGRRGEAAATLEIISRDLAGARPPSGILAGPFTGGPGGEPSPGGDPLELLNFYTRPMRTASAAPGIVGVSYALETGEESGEAVLVRRLETNLLALARVEPEGEILCRAVISFEIFYHDGSEWVENWDSTGAGDTLPRAVEIRLALEGDDGRESRWRKICLLPCAPASREMRFPAGAGS